MEGISVFLSLFDDNPKVKRVFCPPKECFYPLQMPISNTAGLCLLRSLGLLNGKVCALNFPDQHEPWFGEGHQYR